MFHTHWMFPSSCRLSSAGSSRHYMSTVGSHKKKPFGPSRSVKSMNKSATSQRTRHLVRYFDWFLQYGTFLQCSLYGESQYSRVGRTNHSQMFWHVWWSLTNSDTFVLIYWAWSFRLFGSDIFSVVCTTSLKMKCIFNFDVKYVEFISVWPYVLGHDCLSDTHNIYCFMYQTFPTMYI